MLSPLIWSPDSEAVAYRPEPPQKHEWQKDELEDEDKDCPAVDDSLFVYEGWEERARGRQYYVQEEDQEGGTFTAFYHGLFEKWSRNLVPVELGLLSYRWRFKGHGLLLMHYNSDWLVLHDQARLDQLVLGDVGSPWIERLFLGKVDPFRSGSDFLFLDNFHRWIQDLIPDLNLLRILHILILVVFQEHFELRVLLGRQDESLIGLFLVFDDHRFVLLLVFLLLFRLYLYFLDRLFLKEALEVKRFIRQFVFFYFLVETKQRLPLFKFVIDIILWGIDLPLVRIVPRHVVFNVLRISHRHVRFS